MPRAFHCDVVSKWARRSVYLLLSLNSKSNFKISGHCSRVSWKWWSKWSPICKHYGRYSWSNFFCSTRFLFRSQVDLWADHHIWLCPSEGKNPANHCRSWDTNGWVRDLCSQQKHAVVSKNVCTIRNKNCFQMTKQEYQSFRLKHIKRFFWHCWLLPCEFQIFRHIHTSKVKNIHII